MKRIYFLFFLVLFASTSWGQTTLSNGDLVIIGYDTPSDDFAFVTLVDLESGTTIFFTDEEPDGDLTISTNEGHVLYTAPSAISAGTVITYQGNSANFSTEAGSFAPGNSGDGLVAYQGSSAGNVTTFLFAVGEDSGDIGTYPSGFASTLTYGADDGKYSGSTSDTKENLFNLVLNSSNWTTSGSGVSPFTTTSWTISSGTPTVTVANTGSPAASDIAQNTSDAVLFGFSLTPSASVDFTAINIATSGTATTSDLSNFEIVLDADNDGVYDGGESVVSNTLALANPLSFTMSSQTGLTSETRYLLIADVSASATVSRTFTASIAAATDVTTTGDESGTASGNEQTVISSSTPVITVTGTLSSFGNVAAGSNSSSQNYTVEGSNLTADITITAPSGSAVSTDDSNFGSSVTLSQSGGSVSSTTVYARFSPSTGNGSFSNNITHSSTGATTQNQAITGFALDSEPTTAASGISFTSVGENSFTVNWTRGNGDSVLVILKGGSAVDFDPSDASTYTSNAAFGSSTEQGTGNYIVYKGTGTSVAVTSLSSSTTYHAEVIEFNVGSASLTHNYNVTSTLTGNQATDEPSWVINEIQADPDASNGDANGDGVTSTTDDEFVEFVYSGSTAVDISGWVISDGFGDRHTFATGTIVQPNQAVVVFGGGTPTGDFGSAVVATASTTALGLNNGGDTITLKDGDSNTIVTYTYPGSNPDPGNNQSITRDTDISGSFVLHSSATGSGGSLFSPGTKIDGTAFYTPSQEITGSAGWRMLSSPKTGFVVTDLSDDTAIQGITGGSDASEANNFAIYTNSGSFSEPTNTSTAFGDGYGFIVYFYNNTTNGSSTLPITLDVTGTAPTSDVNVNIYSGASGRFTMVGNPFAANVNTNSITVTGGSIQNNIYLWNNASGSYTTADRTTPYIVAPWTGFWVETADENATSITIPTSAKTTTAASATFFAKEAIAERMDINFNLISSYNTDEAIKIQFREDATTAWDLSDATKLTSLNANYAIAGFLGTRDGEHVVKAVESLPLDLSDIYEVELEPSLVGESQNVTLAWDEISGLPDTWSVELIDLATGDKIDLLTESSYSFDLAATAAKTAKSAGPKMQSTGDARFKVVINPDVEITSNETETVLPTQVELLQNYPNPFNPSTQIAFELPSISDVKLTVYNQLGQEVAVLVNGMRAAGKHTVNFDASALSSGIYLYQIEANGLVQTRKMTLIK